MKLYELAHSRTGDKGNISIISVIPYDNNSYSYLKEKLSVEVVSEYMKDIVKGKIVRYELNNLPALNFVLYEALNGGVTQSLSIDRHGKSLSFHLLNIEL